MKKYNKIYYRIIFATMCFVLSTVFMLISGSESLATVSYTHLTLPTIYSV